MLTRSCRARNSVLVLLILVAADLASPQVPGAFTLDSCVDGACRGRDGGDAPRAERFIDVPRCDVQLTPDEPRPRRCAAPETPPTAVWRPPIDRPSLLVSEALPPADDD